MSGVRMRRRDRLLALLVGSLLLGGLAGCSHVKALQPVRPDERTKVRFAAIDVLTESDVRIRDAPQCIRDDRRDVTCLGATADGTAIRAFAPREDPDRLTVQVGDEVLYQGSLARVLVRAAGG